MLIVLLLRQKFSGREVLHYSSYTHMILLSIDTSTMNLTKISLQIDGRVVSRESDSRVLKSQMTLPLIEELLKEEHVTFADISDIRVHTGPGSFTGVRVGISIANTLSFLYNIPINGKHDLAKAIY